MTFRFLGIPVTIQPTFWLFALIFCYAPGRTPVQMLILGLVLFFSLLFHEYGHALAARKFGREPEITLENLGGYASYDAGGLPEKDQFIITLCGPLFTALLIGVSFFFLKNEVFALKEARLFLYCTLKLNILWLGVNLAPLVPLDGGRICAYLLTRFFGEERGHRWSLLLGNITALGGACYFLFAESYLFAYLFLFYGWSNWQIYRSERGRKTTNPYHLYNEAISSLEKNEPLKARSILQRLIRSKDTYIQTVSSEKLADLFEQEGNEQKAYRLLNQLDPEKLHTGKWLLCKLAYSQGNYSLIGRFSQEIYSIRPTFETALLNAKAFSQLRNPTYSIGWLKTAVQFEEGKRNAETLLRDPAFDPIRKSLDFEELLRQLLSLRGRDG